MSQHSEINPDGIRQLGDEGIYPGDWVENTQVIDGEEVIASGVVSATDEDGNPLDAQGRIIALRTEGYWRVCRKAGA